MGKFGLFKPGLVSFVIIEACILLCCARTGPASEQQEQIERPGLEKLREAKEDLSITIFPVLLMNNPQQEIARITALLLEKTGVRTIEVSEQEFMPWASGDPEKTADEFEQFIAKNPPSTDYAMFVEFIGTPQTGPKGVLTIVADKAGEVVWLDHQTPSDKLFGKVNPHGPMEMALIAVEGLRLEIGLDDPNEKGAYRGKWAEYYENKAQDYGTPSKEEQKEIDARSALFFESAKNSRMMVYGVYTLGREPSYSNEGVESLATTLRDQGIENVEILQSPENIDFKPGPNQQKMFWQRFRLLASKVPAIEAEADYTMMLDIAGNPDVGVVLGVHVYVVGGDGEIVYGTFWNSHNKLFKKHEPGSVEDVCGMLAEHFDDKLQ